MLVAACALIAATPAHAGPGPAPPETAIESMRGPGSISRWAFVERRTPVRAAPDHRARQVATLGTRTEDRTDELVPILSRARARNGGEWPFVRLPVRPNGTTGWVPRAALGTVRRVSTHLYVDTRRLTARLYRNGKLVFRARVGVGQRRWPTPRGEFYIRNRLTGWGGIYGPLAFGTSARSDVLTDWPGGGVIGIHGTNRPELLPGRVSHGCIRMRNADILRLGRLLLVGTPLTIR